jgi:hypothetical protein
MKLLFLPIDIDLENFSFLQEENSEKNNLFNPWWNSTFIDKSAVEENNFNRILNQLPFTKITRLFYKTQKTSVSPHIDVMPAMTMEDGEYDHIKENEPCGYRIVINGSVDKLRINTGSKWVETILPSIPSCYLINSSETLHSVDFDPSRQTIYIRGFIDVIRHNELIEKSLQKYKDYAIYKS